MGRVRRAAGQERGDRPRHHRGRRPRDVQAGKAEAAARTSTRSARSTTRAWTPSAIEALGTKPIEAPMARIAAIASPADLPAALAALEKSDGLAPFGVGAGPDLKNSESHHRQRRPGRLEPARARTTTCRRTRACSGSATRTSRTSRTCSSSTARATPTPRRTRKTVLDDRDEVRRGVDGSRHDAQSERRLPHDDRRAVRLDHAAPQLGDVPADAGRAADRREINVAQPDFFKAMDGFLDVDSGRRLEDAAALAPAQHRGARRCRSASPTRTSRSASCSPARRSGCRAGRRARANTDGALGEAVGQEYVEAHLHARGEGARQGDRRQHGRRAARPDRPARVDERRDEDAGARQARRVHAQDRLSRQVARLLDARRQAAASTTANQRARRPSGTQRATGRRSASRSTAPSGA